MAGSWLAAHGFIVLRSKVYEVHCRHPAGQGRAGHGTARLVLTHRYLILGFQPQRQLISPPFIVGDATSFYFHHNSLFVSFSFQTTKSSRYLSPYLVYNDIGRLNTANFYACTDVTTNDIGGAERCVYFPHRCHLQIKRCLRVTGYFLQLPRPVLPRPLSAPPRPIRTFMCS